MKGAEITVLKNGALLIFQGNFLAQARESKQKVQQACIALWWQNMQMYQWQNVQEANTSWAGG